jgi:hypothetical protein
MFSEDEVWTMIQDLS